jgi:hypothetical protein
MLATVAAIFLAGCASSTREARIKERSAEFAALRPEQQEAVRYGEIGNGFTADMVYIALGKPSLVEAGDEGALHAEVWTYRNYVPGSDRPRLKRKGGAMAPMSKGLGVFSSLPSDASAHGDMVNPPRSSGGGGDSAAESGAVTLRILFQNGIVAAISTRS